jgi:prepilin-type N-terminal cleavage/methylation domain-containing protein
MIVREHEIERAVRPVRAGFTLMELLVVVSIIVVLAGLGGVYYFSVQYDAQKSAAITQMKSTLATAVEMYRVDHEGAWPQSLEELLQRDEFNKGPYLKNVDALKTPWTGRFYQLNLEMTQQSDQPVIFCVTPREEMLSNVPLPQQ